MADCKTCKRTDVKCCPTCGRKGTNCDVWHHCGEDCPGYDEPKQTNADRIRSLSDEELAEFLEEFEVCTHCKYADGIVCTFENPCTHGFASAMAYEWLKSEVKE